MRAYPLRLAAAAAVAALLAGCTNQSPETSVLPKHLRPLSHASVTELESKGMSKSDPVLVRIYKKESDFEVWKKRKSDGRYAHFKTYKICKWSGDVGPKLKEGDRQTPEGFYAVTPGQMNPNSSYYLSFNIGYPNAFDRALGRDGGHIMVHGDCSSRGCFSMTDAQMQEIYSLMREAFDGGQKSVQVQSYPFRMTAQNLARYRGHPNMSFWRNLKQGNDHFEVTGLEPKVDVCGKRYVFDAEGGSFNPSAACPTYRVRPEIAVAVAEKAKKDEQDEKDEIALAGLDGKPAETAAPAAAPATPATAPAKTEVAVNAPAAAKPVEAASAAQPNPPSGSSLFALSWLRSTSQAPQASQVSQPSPQ
ncbi:MAG: murein L,D-transpeptidase, partial [Pseudomonadota bacterium]|nr:murein L,D-transpeptidase [Pseudomonadota bacterium]